MPGRSVSTTTAVAAISVLIAALGAARAEQTRPQGNQQEAGQTSGAKPAPPQPPVLAAKPLVPVAASTLAAAPDTYIGEPVSLAGVVDRTLSRTAFSVDQDRKTSGGKDVLVVAPTLQRDVQIDTYVTVIGEVIRFDPEALAAKLKEYKLDVAPDVAASYAGKPAVIASSVVDSSGNDLARRLPPPMTAEEEGYQKLMKQVASANGSLRKAVEASDTKLTTEQSALLRKTFVDVETFWRGKRRDDAVEWAQDARKSAENMERAAAAGRWDAVKSHAAALGKTCQACHGVHRERFDDGSFRIKKLSSS